MALPDQPWSTSYPGSQDTPGSEQPNLIADTTPGAEDGHRILVSHFHALRDKLQSVATKLGDGSNLPSGSVGDKVATLEAGHAALHENGGAGEISLAGLSGLSATPQTPATHASSHEPGGGDAMAVDAVVGTGSLRTLGTGAQQACAGNDARLSDARTPTSHASSHDAGGGDAMAIDAAAGTGSLRTLGTGAQQACAGNDSRLSDARTPTSHASSHEPGGGDAMSVDAVAGTGSLRTLGTGAQQACAGNDSRLSDARTPTAHNLGGSEHNADTLANLNAKVSDATLDTNTAKRPPGSPAVNVNASGPVSVTAAQTGDAFTNEGAAGEVNHNLPTAAAGLTYTFIVQVAQNLRVTAASGDTIRVAGSVSAAAGNIVNAVVGSTVILLAINATEWIALGTPAGTWTVT